jgi:DNA repair exonuclease SbcCD ATPase subunit
MTTKPAEPVATLRLTELLREAANALEACHAANVDLLNRKAPPPPIAAPSRSAEQPASGTYTNEECQAETIRLQDKELDARAARIRELEEALDKDSSDAAWLLKWTEQKERAEAAEKRVKELEALEVEARHYAQGRLDKLQDRVATATALLREERDAIQDRYDLLTTEIAQGPDLIGRMRRERDAANARCSELKVKLSAFGPPEYYRDLVQRANAATARCRELEDLLEVARVYVRFAEGEGMEIDGLDDRIDALLGKK